MPKTKAPKRTEFLTVRLSPRHLAAVKRLARERGYNVSDVVREILLAAARRRA